MEFLRNFSQHHEDLKKRIHSFRIPLGPTGRRIMGVVYFSIPVVLGIQIMNWAQAQAIKNLGENNEILKAKHKDSGAILHSAGSQGQKEALKQVLDRLKQQEEK